LENTRFVLSENQTAVLIVSAFSEGRKNFIAREAREWVSANPSCGWRLVHTPEQAEMILFLEHHPARDPLFLRVLFHPWQLKWPDKCWLYNDCDFAFPFMRGIYPGLERRSIGSGAVKSWFYVAQICENEAVEYVACSGSEPYLYSFTGACYTHRVRNEIFKLKDGRAWIQDTSNQNNWELSSEELAIYHKKYAQIINNSKFVLCPRGFSPTSYRLLETMKAGRVPVIISDAWVLPDNLNWNAFAIIVPESKVSQIPQLLRRHEPEAVARGLAARKSWENWCADDIKYERLLNQFESMAKSKANMGVMRLRTALGCFTSWTRLRLLWHSVKYYHKFEPL